ncbi:MAG: deoxyribose-phosphate aldolase [Candidatus Zixiibacteriota bacterium]
MDKELMDLNLKIDHAALQPEVDEAAIRRLCCEAREYLFYSVAVNPAWTALAVELLKKTSVKVLTVAGFPLGANRTDVKIVEAVEGVSDGAHEIDMVANIGRLCAGQFSDVEAEIRKVRRNLPPEVILKVIIEAGRLTEQQQVEATKCVINGGAQFVKTCTGFFGGATVEQVRTLFRAAEGQIEVKASGGIRTLEDCQRLLSAGATRLGSSASVAIMKEFATLY